MQDINSVTFTGRLTADPEIRTTQSDKAVGRMRVAIQRPSGKDGSDRGAAFYDVEVWNAVAKSCGAYLQGSAVAVESRLEHQQWTDDNDQPRQRNYIVASRVRLLQGGVLRLGGARRIDARLVRTARRAMQGGRRPTPICFWTEPKR